MDPDVTAHYSLGVEERRLTEDGSSRIEFERTKELLARTIPTAPQRILDIGGGPGRYASWLAGRGHRVSLVDVVALHVEQAKVRAAQDAAFDVVRADARRLPFLDRLADVTLLMGPLYHLPDAHDRATALSEAGRVTRPGGIVVVAVISRFASLLDGLRSGALGDATFRGIVDEDLRTGVHRNPTGRPEYFTTAFFHRPDDIRREIEAAGLRCDVVFGVEGPGWLLAERWDGDEDRENILRVARALEREGSVIGTSSHLLAFATRPSPGPDR
jgi:SAM-dependent methyltransferase